jgi:hypothetical protein
MDGALGQQLWVHVAATLHFISSAPGSLLSALNVLIIEERIAIHDVEFAGAKQSQTMDIRRRSIFITRGPRSTEPCTTLRICSNRYGYGNMDG